MAGAVSKADSVLQDCTAGDRMLSLKDQPFQHEAETSFILLLLW